MPGFDNGTVFCNNVDFTGAATVTPQVTTDGQLLIGSTASPNIKVGSITSGDSSITVTAGSGTLALSVAGGATVGKTITGDAGGALVPTLGNWNIVGTTAQGVTSSGAGSTLTFTNADASETQKGVSELATDAESIAGTDAIRTIVPTSLKAKLGTQTNHGVLVGAGNTAAITALTPMTNGQLLIGSTGVDPVPASLTAGTNIVITPGAGSISIAATGGGDVTGPAGATTTAIAIYDGATGKIIQNSVPTIDSNGNILTSASISGATLSIDVVNSSNTASSVARMSTTVAGSSAGDAIIQNSVSGGQVWTYGLDNSDSDAYVLASSVSLGTTNVMRVSVDGEINYPLQPGFKAYLSATATDVTGDATAYTIAANTEVFDKNLDYDNTTFTFTAPVSGQYLFSCIYSLSGLLVTHTSSRSFIITSNFIYEISNLSPFTITSAGGVYYISSCQIAEMDAMDTCSFRINVSGGTKVVDVIGGLNAAVISGVLLA